MTDVDEDYDTTERMIAGGGSFVKQLGALWRLGDPANRAILKAAFPGYWRKYAPCHLSERGGRCSWGTLGCDRDHQGTVRG